MSARSEFERDWDRIVFSQAFRRLHDKTQVFPLPSANDEVHSRLTHSLEVACVARMLGMLVGHEVCRRESVAFTPHDLSSVVAAAALAHDIGNAPLGHAGEVSIRQFFSRMPARSLDDVMRRRFDELTSRQVADLQSFDGNPQGFRVLVRLEQEKVGGMQLTAATLGAFTKYPWPSADRRAKGKTRAKFGFYEAEQSFFEVVAGETGLIPMREGGWARHPLALLVEAADNICYSILDIEDGVRLGFVPNNEAFGILATAAANDGDSNTANPDLVQYRASAIEHLVLRVKEQFLKHYDEIMAGTYAGSLTDGLPGVEALKSLAFKNCYSSTDVLELEIAGDRAIGGLLEAFICAVVVPDTVSTASRLLKARGVCVESTDTAYGRMLRVIDYLSGMTDGYVFDTYRRLAGIDLRGRVA